MKVKVIRSTKRRKTVSAKMVGEVIHLYLPSEATREEEQRFVAWAKKRFEASRRKKKLQEKNADEMLNNRARMLNRRYFNDRFSWNRISFSVDQNSHMFGNCNYEDQTIRISDRLLRMPKFVLDYVIVHELTHLEIPRHGPEFWKVCSKYPKTERARGYLMAVAMKD